MNSEKEKLMNDPEYASAFNDLVKNKRFNNDPQINDVKWLVYNRRLTNYSSNGLWGLYRNTKLEMAQLLQKENRLNDSLRYLLVVFYLDLNGCDNLPEGLSKSELKKIWKEGFDLFLSYVNPYVVETIHALISELNQPNIQTKEILYSVIDEFKPLIYEPITEEKAWKVLTSKIDEINKNYQIVDSLNTTNSILKEARKAIKVESKHRLQLILAKIKKLYKTRKSIVQNFDDICLIIEELLYTTDSNIGENLLLHFAKKNPTLFEPLVKKFIKLKSKSLNELMLNFTIGKYGVIEPSWVKDYIPKLIKIIKTNSNWNNKRFASFNLGMIGTKFPNYVSEVIPIIISFLKKPELLNPWLKDAYIETLGKIAKTDRSLIIQYRSVFEELSRKDISEDTRNGAVKLLNILDS